MRYTLQCQFEYHQAQQYEKGRTVLYTSCAYGGVPLHGGQVEAVEVPLHLVPLLAVDPFRRPLHDQREDAHGAHLRAVVDDQHV